jgi:hypothetical protein
MRSHASIQQLCYYHNLLTRIPALVLKTLPQPVPPDGSLLCHNHPLLMAHYLTTLARQTSRSQLYHNRPLLNTHNLTKTVPSLWLITSSQPSPPNCKQPLPQPFPLKCSQPCQNHSRLFANYLATAITSESFTTLPQLSSSNYSQTLPQPSSPNHSQPSHNYPLSNTDNLSATIPSYI